VDLDLDLRIRDLDLAVAGLVTSLSGIFVPKILKILKMDNPFSSDN